MGRGHIFDLIDDGTIIFVLNSMIIIGHHSASPDVAAATMHDWHLQKGWSGIGYHFVIRQTGSIEAGHPLATMGVHAGPEVNGDSIGICLAGNFMEYAPTKEQLVSLARLIIYLRDAYNYDLEVLRHKDVAATDCPGDCFPWPEKNWPLFAPAQGENGPTNTIEPWKIELMQRASEGRLITDLHNPNDPAPKWFVLAVGLRILEEVRKDGGNQTQEDGCQTI